MLELFASKQDPRAEHDVRCVGMNHREKNVIVLERNHAEVDNHAADGIPRVPRLQHESGNFNGDCLVCRVILLQLCAVTEEGDSRPKHRRCHNCDHHQIQKATHLGERNLMVPERET